MSPEYPNLKSDLWNIGILTFILLTGEYPYTGKRQKQIKLKMISKNMNC